MRLLTRVAAGMPVRRRVAAADRAAGLTHPEVPPAGADLQALLATCDLLRRIHDHDLVEVRAHVHDTILGRGRTQARTEDHLDAAVLFR